VWQVSNGKKLLSLFNHGDKAYTAEFSPDDAFIVTASKDKTIKLWDATNGDLLATFKNGKDAMVAAKFSPDGGQVVTTMGKDRGIKVWRVPSEQRTPTDIMAMVKDQIPLSLEQDQIIPAGDKP
jgi:WD40 repeat protein